MNIDSKYVNPKVINTEVKPAINLIQKSQEHICKQKEVFRIASIHSAVAASLITGIIEAPAMGNDILKINIKLK